MAFYMSNVPGGESYTILIHIDYRIIGGRMVWVLSPALKAALNVVECVWEQNGSYVEVLVETWPMVATVYNLASLHGYSASV